jgi:hypothetical protein
LQHELISIVRIVEIAPDVDVTRRLDFEREDRFGRWWWSLNEIAVSDQRFYPRRLPTLIHSFLAGDEIAEPLEKWPWESPAQRSRPKSSWFRSRDKVTPSSLIGIRVKPSWSLIADSPIAVKSQIVVLGCGHSVNLQQLSTAGSGLRHLSIADQHWEMVFVSREIYLRVG